MHSGRTYRLLRVLFLGVCLLLGLPGSRVEAKVLLEDSIGVVHQSFDQQRLQQQRESGDFDFPRADEPRMSLLDRLLQKIFDFDPPQQKSGEVSSGLGMWLKLLLAIIGAAALIYVILRMLKVNLPKILRKDSDEVDLGVQVVHEDLRELDLDKMLAESLENRNFRLAIRVLYLRVLRNLTRRGDIIWQPEKTNHDYLRELRKHPQLEQFKHLTFLFEYAWYGELELDEGQFEEAKSRFIAFSEQLKGGEG